MIWPLSYLFDERHGSYSVRKVNGKSVLFQRVKAPKSLTSVSLCPQSKIWVKEFAFPTERLSKKQKEHWFQSVADKAPINVLTGQQLDPLRPEVAMFHVLAKRR